MKRTDKDDLRFWIFEAPEGRCVHYPPRERIKCDCMTDSTVTNWQAVEWDFIRLRKVWHSTPLVSFEFTFDAD